MRTGGIFGNGALGIVGRPAGLPQRRSQNRTIRQSYGALGTVGGGIFGQEPASGLGIDPPFPDVYGCNTNDQCQSGWCNTAVTVPGAAGQCQTPKKVNPTVATWGLPGLENAYCSSDENCDADLSLICNTQKKRCERKPGFLVGNLGLLSNLADSIGYPDGYSGARMKTYEEVIDIVASNIDSTSERLSFVYNPFHETERNVVYSTHYKNAYEMGKNHALQDRGTAKGAGQALAIPAKMIVSDLQTLWNKLANWVRESTGG